jgi:hypothetical protein
MQPPIGLTTGRDKSGKTAPAPLHRLVRAGHRVAQPTPRRGRSPCAPPTAAMRPSPAPAPALTSFVSRVVFRPSPDGGKRLFPKA